MPKEPEKWERTRLTLIGRLKNREDQESWDKFVHLYWKRLYQVCMSSQLSDAEAKDACQETLQGVMKDIEKYDPALGRFSPWLLGRLKWRINDQLRDRKHQPKRGRTRTSTGTGTLDRIPDQASLKREEQIESEWREYIFKLALEHLKKTVKPAQFQIFDLLVNKKLPVEEVSSITGATRENIYTIKHRLLALLEEEVKSLQDSAP